MSTPLNIALLAFPRCQVLDITGPAMVFEGGNDATGRCHYNVQIVSAHGGPVQTSSAVVLMTTPICDLPPQTIDTLLISGGEDHGLRKLAADETVRDWAIQASAGARRYGSICTGTFALAHLGLLKDRKVTTHWSACSSLAEGWPDVDVDTNALFINDGNLWTSAGVTTGIDMSLSMVAADLGNAIANMIAKRLVLYARRPGYQSQFSPVLHAQSDSGAPFAELIDWIRENLVKNLDVPMLAARASMSERTFLRHFTKVTGETPAHFIESLRLNRARVYLSTDMPLKEIASRIGYLNATQLSKAFDRRFGMAPSLFRELHFHESDTTPSAFD